MDWSSLAGLAVALVAIFVTQLVDGGSISSLLQPTALLIVVFGTLGAVMLQHTLPVFMHSLRMVRAVFVTPPDDLPALEKDLRLWSTVARRDGFLGLERYLGAVRDPFLAKGLRLVIDGFDPLKISDILETEIDRYQEHERLAARVWIAAGGYAPTIGILGAVLGLIQVMEHLSEPSKLGSGIAVAFVSTIYGVGLANLVFLPVGSKLKALIGREVMRRDMLCKALCGIAAGENPRLIEERMGGYLNGYPGSARSAVAEPSRVPPAAVSASKLKRVL